MTDLYKVHDLGQLAFSHNRAQAAIGLQRITDLNRLSTLLQPRVKFVGDAFVDQESRCCAADLPVRPEATKLHTTEFSALGTTGRYKHMSIDVSRYLHICQSEM